MLVTLAINAIAEPNPPTWPASVAVFGPGDAGMQDTINAAFATNGGHSPGNHGQFSDKRFAFLFKPGTYEEVEVPVGYYTHVMGLGEVPSDVTFQSAKGVYSEEGDYSIGGALSTFWRSAENFKTAANQVRSAASFTSNQPSTAPALRALHLITIAATTACPFSRGGSALV